MSMRGDICSDPPEKSCADAGCPVHGDDREWTDAEMYDLLDAGIWPSWWNGDRIEGVSHS